METERTKAGDIPQPREGTIRRPRSSARVADEAATPLGVNSQPVNWSASSPRGCRTLLIEVAVHHRLLTDHHGPTTSQTNEETR
jgi:hypothetical protein